MKTASAEFHLPKTNFVKKWQDIMHMQLVIYTNETVACTYTFPFTIGIVQTLSVLKTAVLIPPSFL